MKNVISKTGGDTAHVELENHGHSYSMLATTYSFESKGSVLMSDMAIGNKQKELLFERACEVAINKVVQDMAADLAKEVRKMYVREVNQAVRKHFKENKKAIVKKMVNAAKKDAMRRLEEVEEDY